jgi:hypothetical protein
MPVSGISNLRLAPPWLVAGLVFGLLVIFARRSDPTSSLWQTLLGFATYGIAGIVMRTWLILLARSRLALSQRQDLSDGVRVAILVAVFAASSLLAIGLTFGLLLLPAMVAYWTGLG